MSEFLDDFLDLIKKHQTNENHFCVVEKGCDNCPLYDELLDTGYRGYDGCEFLERVHEHFESIKSKK